LIRPHYWELFSKKLREKIDRLRFVGYFTKELAEERGMRLIKAKEENFCLYWLVDESDGIIADAKFQVLGPVGLIAVAEVVSELVLRKNYDQVSRISADLIDQHVRDRKDRSAFPKECDPYLNLALSAIDRAVQQCLDIPFAASYDITPIERDFGEIPGGIPGWSELSYQQKIFMIEEVIDKEIRPYIELDAGGVKLVSFNDSGEVIISYEGSCTTCHSSTGSTLSAIQQILKSRVHPTLFVTPQM
jgi:NifU-like protein